MLNSGFVSLFRKEVNRFTKVFTQTVVTPMVTSLLYLVVFAHVLAERQMPGMNVNYIEFLVPGLVMMTVVQNAFANSSSSMVQSKMNGSVIFMLLAPLSYIEVWAAYVGAAIVRGVIVGAGVYVASLIYVEFSMHSLVWALVFSILAGTVLGGLGMIGGVLAEKYDHLSAFQNFVVMPLSFLSGVFYSIQSLPQPWNTISQFNPLFYMIDGFRYGIIGVSDVSPWFSFTVAASFAAAISIICILLLRSGYRLRY